MTQHSLASIADAAHPSALQWVFRVSRLSAMLALTLVLALFGVGSAPASADAPAPRGAEGAAARSAEAAPDLSVTLISDVEEIASGDAVTYTAVIANKGGALQARVVFTPPAYVVLGAVDEAAVVDGGTATWSLTLPPGEATTLQIPATVGDIPTDELRATALLSVYVGDASTPLVRTASADPIAGVDDEQTVAGPLPGVIVMIGAGVGVLLIVVAGVLILVRRRRRTVAVATQTWRMVGAERE